MDLGSNLIVAVIGAGAMGSGIAQVAAAAGHRVVVIDQEQAALARGRALLADSLSGLVKRGKLSAEAADELRAAVTWSTDFQAVAPAGLVIEAIVERAEIKEALFETLGAWLAPARSWPPTPRPWPSPTWRAPRPDRKTSWACISSIPPRP